jgi:hypothetical protein
VSDLISTDKCDKTDSTADDSAGRKVKLELVKVRQNGAAKTFVYRDTRQKKWDRFWAIFFKNKVQ